ncbi:MAG TPA: aminotransferase class V-fold PLP-dependent enzyme [Pyrinomonadaceae bacterium]|nr:aminotransferase class V-fold PLP-dependent enzyme [Pyrinomonadaceae bacterium]
MIDWSNIRAQFPVTRNSTYLNTAAAGPLAVSTKEAASAYYQQMLDDGDIHWDDWLLKREEVRARVASFINAEPDEIGLTTNTSSGMNLIIDALASHGEVIACDLEFPVSTIPWMHRMIPVHLIQSSANGEVLPEEYVSMMNVRTGVISVSYVQYSNGLRTDIDALGELKGGHALVVNASQAAGVFEIDVKRMKIDALCATGHKWMLSGYGSGFVYINRELLARSRPHAIGWLSVQDPYGDSNNEVHLRHDASARTELGCPHFAGMFALGASIDMMQSIGMKNIQERALSLNQKLTGSLTEAGWKVLSPLRDENMRSAETLVQADKPDELVASLAEKEIIVTRKPQGVRISTDFFNDEEDVEVLLGALKDISNR